MILKSLSVPITSLPKKYVFLEELYEKVLSSDPLWHFFLDGEKVVVRFSPHYEKRLRSYLKKWIKNPDIIDFSPTLHEYRDIRFVGEDLVPLFHELSLLSLKYPSYVMTNPILERLNHILVNQQGIHDFEQEAKIYSNLALNRSVLAGKYQK